MLQADPGIYLTGAFLVLLLPLNWLAAAAAAALFHELCHILALKISGGTVLRIHFKWNGCVIEVDRLEPWQRIFSILAGPVGSISLLFLHRLAPRIAVCGIFQGFFNLLPVLPLDGGRVIQELLYCFCPDKADILILITEMLIRLAIMAGMLYLILLD